MTTTHIGRITAACVTIALVAAGCQTINASLDSRQPAAGQLVDIGGRRLHLVCAGQGAPTVILQSGLGEGSDYWKLIAKGVARETRVCAYDRAGRGFSDPAATPQDGYAVADDLRALLDAAGPPQPVVLVGHSTGAVYARIFAGSYPEHVAGLILLDGQPAEAFERLPNYPSFYRNFGRVLGLLPRRWVGSLRDELGTLPATLREAQSFGGVSDRPLTVVTASQDAQQGWLPLQHEMAALSTNSRHLIVPYAHADLVTDRFAALVSVEAITTMVHTVRRAVS